jgi:hypothetical protein
MAIYSKGSRPYRGPYSPDFTESKVTGLDRDSYDPAHTADAVRQGNPVVKNVDGRGFNLSGVIDAQADYGAGFDDARGKAGAWQRTKSDASLGGFSGPISGLGSPSSSHPRRGLVKKNTL